MMKNAKTKYEFYGQELVRIKNLLGNEPVGPKADKRKKEIVELETKVCSKNTHVHVWTVCDKLTYVVGMMGMMSVVQYVYVNGQYTVHTHMVHYFHY